LEKVNVLSVLILSALLLSPIPSVAVECSDDGGRVNYMVKQYFPIGTWFEGRPDWAGSPADPDDAKSYYDRCFADLAAHGFNTVAVPNCPEDLWEVLLKSADAHGIKVILEVKPLVDLVKPEPVSENEVRNAVKAVADRIGSYKSLVRYQIRDEPPMPMVPNWLMIQRELALADPTRPAFSCFCHQDSLARIAEQTKLSEAVFDIYPQGLTLPQQSLGNFLPALDGYKAAARGGTMWAVLQSFAKPVVWRYPTPEELRAMTYLSLAAGVKGIFYFLYQSMPDHPEKLEGLIDPQGRPTWMYAPTAKLVEELGKLSSLILSLVPTGVQPEVEGDARAGSFVDNVGRRILIVASTTPGEATSAHVKVIPDGSWRDELTGDIFRSTEGTLELPLAPGGGRVLVRFSGGKT
jgi:hypothetical protein